MKKVCFFLFLFLFSLFPFFSKAEDAPVINFSASPNGIVSGQMFSLIWQSSQGGAPFVKAICPVGVKLYYGPSGPIFPCDGVYRKISDRSSDYINLYAINVVGFSQPVNFFLLPTDGGGNENSGMVKTTSIIVSSDPEPIKSFTASSTIESGIPFIVSWSSENVFGVNFKFYCNPNIYASSSFRGGARLNCDQYMSDVDFPSKSSFEMMFENTTQYDLEAKLTVFPAFEAGMYDSSHAKTLTFTVKPFLSKQILLKDYSVSKSVIENGENLSVKWNFENSFGVNLKTVCQEGVEFSLVSGTTTTKGVCGSFLSNNDLSNSGSLEFVLNNSSGYAKNFTLALLAKKKDGTYDNSSVKQFDVKVLPVGQKNQSVFTNVNIATTSKNNVNVGNNVPNKVLLTRSLYFGFRGSEVSVLQEFLIKENVYPEALVTGYFGRATERAVQKFQEKYGLAKKGDSGYGFVGPKTRSKILDLTK